MLHKQCCSTNTMQTLHWRLKSVSYSTPEITKNQLYIYHVYMYVSLYGRRSKREECGHKTKGQTEAAMLEKCSITLSAKKTLPVVVSRQRARETERDRERERALALLTGTGAKGLLASSTFCVPSPPAPLALLHPPEAATWRTCVDAAG